MNDKSLADMDLQRRAFGQYLNYLTNHRAKGVRTITLENIPIDTEILQVADRIKDLKTRIATEKTRIEA